MATSGAGVMAFLVKRSDIVLAVAVIAIIAVLIILFYRLIIIR